MFDQDKSQKLQLAEFQNLYCSLIYGDKTEIGNCNGWAIGLHGAYDSDQNSLLDHPEFEVLQSIFTMGTESLLELYSLYDANTDGYFSVEEYQTLVCTEISEEIECEADSALLYEVKDFDEDGLISKYEFFYIHHLYCRDVTEKSINELFDEYSLTIEDKLTLDEFTLLFCEECKMEEVPQCEENAMDDFEQYDVEQDNLLSESEFTQLYNIYFSEGNEFHKDYLFTVYDTDYDNMLSLIEFKELSCN